MLGNKGFDNEGGQHEKGCNGQFQNELHAGVQHAQRIVNEKSEHGSMNQFVVVAINFSSKRERLREGHADFRCKAKHKRLNENGVELRYIFLIGGVNERDFRHRAE